MEERPGMSGALGWGSHQDSKTKRLKAVEMKPSAAGRWSSEKVLGQACYGAVWKTNLLVRGFSMVMSRTVI